MSEAEIAKIEWAVGERGFSHYTMKWGTVERLDTPWGDEPASGWFDVRNDDGSRDYLNNVRFIRPAVAKRYGYGDGPKEAAHAAHGN